MKEKKYYIYFTQEDIYQKAPDNAGIVHDINAVLGGRQNGYTCVLVNIERGNIAKSAISFLGSFSPSKTSERFDAFFGLNEKLEQSSLYLPFDRNAVMPWKKRVRAKLLKELLVQKILPSAALLHVREDWGMVKAAISSGVPVIFEQERPMSRKLEKEFCDNELLQVVVTLADKVEQDLMVSGIPGEKILNVPNAMNEAFLERVPEKASSVRNKFLADDNGKKLVVYTGALYDFKGVGTLLECASDIPEAVFLVAGGREDQVDKYRQDISDKGIENVRMLGHMLQSDVIALHQAADILVQPHKTGKFAEISSPLKFFEYLASGTPIVTTHIDPILEFKEHPLAIEWSPGYDVDSVRDAIKNAISKFPRRENGYQENVCLAKQYTSSERIRKILGRVDPDILKNIKRL